LGLSSAGSLHLTTLGYRAEFLRVSQQLHLSTTNEVPGSIELATVVAAVCGANPALYAEFAKRWLHFNPGEKMKILD
jgi:hypothetical protein